MESNIVNYKIDKLNSLFKKYLKKEDIEKINKAYFVAAKAHANQFRKSKEPYFNHLVEVAIILAESKASANSIIIGLLHDILEDTIYSPLEIQNEFGNEVIETIRALTKIKSEKYKNDLDQYLQQLIIGISTNKEILLIKLADRLHNMRTLSYMDETKQKRIATETKKIYVPIASRLGLHWIKTELEDLCFKYLDKTNYIKVKKLVDSDKLLTKKFVTKVQDDLDKLLASKGAKIVYSYSRKKHLYSIYKKIESGKNYKQIYDILAIRIITTNIIECYKILGIISENYNLISNRFKDYINNPKENFYQAIHLGMMINGIPIEVQIMTEEMELKSLIGLSSHTDYKEIHTKLLKNNNFLDYIMDFSNNMGKKLASKDFINLIDDELFNITINILTPMGDKVVVPKGSTALDFAFKIHTDLGKHASFAIVDGIHRSLNYILNESDIVDIVTDDKKIVPLKAIEWVTSKQNATKIKELYENENSEIPQEINIAYGKQIVHEFIANNPEYNKILSEKMLSVIARKIDLKSINDLYVVLAKKEKTMQQLINLIKKDSRVIRNIDQTKKKNQQLARFFIFPEESKYLNNKVNIQICKECKPIYKEKIKAEINNNLIYREKKVVIHRNACKKVKDKSGTYLDIKWNTNIKSKFISNTVILIKADDRKNIMHDIIESANIADVKIVNIIANLNKNTNNIDIKLTIDLYNIEQLERLFLNLNNIIGIIRISRT